VTTTLGKKKGYVINAAEVHLFLPHPKEWRHKFHTLVGSKFQHDRKIDLRHATRAFQVACRFKHGPKWSFSPCYKRMSDYNNALGIQSNVSKVL
jgi:hypothetical protein